MNESAAIVVAAMLTEGESNAIATTPSENGLWPCFVSFLPDSKGVPANAICVYDSPGTSEGRTLDTGKNLFINGVQVKVRAVDYVTGWEMISTICNYFENVLNAVVSSDEKSYDVQSIRQELPFIPLGKEATGLGRELFVANFSIFVRRL